jgi:hypothetical protein
MSEMVDEQSLLQGERQEFLDDKNGTLFSLGRCWINVA